MVREEENFSGVQRDKMWVMGQNGAKETCWLKARIPGDKKTVIISCTSSEEEKLVALASHLASLPSCHKTFCPEIDYDPSVYPSHLGEQPTAHWCSGCDNSAMKGDTRVWRTQQQLVLSVK